MNEQGHISEHELLEAAKERGRLGSEELRHLEQCGGCIDRFAELIRNLIADPPTAK